MDQSSPYFGVRLLPEINITKYYIRETVKSIIEVAPPIKKSVQKNESPSSIIELRDFPLMQYSCL
ncbi:hypothetical protein D5F53_13480 [Paenibacillus lautus]|uniref:Uncharacterized protein n=1 Tax=Paenibacillus lautus TaxID=1401 RepID=A0A385TNS0_PAELA|nr:hypothetical protein D5F53_13480 [Paenibacillus lautus]